MAGLSLPFTNRKYFVTARELWWFPMVVFTAAALICLAHLNLANANQYPITVYSATVFACVSILPAEFAMLHYHQKIQTYRAMQYEFGVTSRSTINCILYAGSAMLSGLNERSISGILFFYLVAAAVVSGERLLETKTDLGLVLFLISCAVSQAYLLYGLGFWFFVFIGLSWFFLNMRGFLVDAHAARASGEE